MLAFRLTISAMSKCPVNFCDSVSVAISVPVPFGLYQPCELTKQQQKHNDNGNTICGIQFKGINC